MEVWSFLRRKLLKWKDVDEVLVSLLKLKIDEKMSSAKLLETIL